MIPDFRLSSTGIPLPAYWFVSVDYIIRPLIAVSARTAYDWCVDFQPDDVKRLGKEGRRKVERLNEDTFLLTDTFHTEDCGRVVKQRLVCLDPERLSWTNTHTKGPSKHSQFLYEIVPEGGNACRLDFTGRQLVSVDAIDSRQRSELARSIRREDSGTWKLLARAIAADLRPRKKGTSWSRCG